MRKYGPLKNMTCIRFEGKHKQIKENSKICKTRLNPSFTLALRHQLQLCYRFFCNRDFEDHIYFGSIISKLNLINNYKFFKNLLPFNEFEDYNSVKWITINGTKYEINSLACLNINEINPVFGKIKHIIISPLKNIYFLYIEMITVCYCRHLSAFEVKETQQWGFLKKISPIAMYIMFKICQT